VGKGRQHDFKKDILEKGTLERESHQWGESPPAGRGKRDAPTIEGKRYARGDKYGSTGNLWGRMTGGDV